MNLIHSAEFPTTLRTALAAAWPARATDKSIGVVAALCFLGLLLAKFVLQPHVPALCSPLYAMVFLTLGWIILHRPYWGIIVTAAALPLRGMFMDMPIPITMVFSLVSAAIVLGLIRDGASFEKLKASVRWTHVWAGLFLVWVFVSHPKAATELSKYDSLWTLTPLLALSFLTTHLLATPERQRLLMISFVVVSVVSALVAIPEATIPATSESSIRGYGLSAHPNATAIYCLISLVFLNYLMTERESVVFGQTPKHRFKVDLEVILQLISAGILLLGIAATASRTAALILPIILLSIAFPRRSAWQRSIQLPALVFTLVVVALLVPHNYWRLIGAIPISIFEATDSIGFRYTQWQAGIEMFMSHAISGVGIGQFERNVHFAVGGIAPFYGTGFDAHSLYVSLLAETGMIGLLLYCCFVISSLWYPGKMNLYGDQDSAVLSRTWITILAVLLFAGITGDWQFSKILWIVMGASNAVRAKNTA